MSTTSLAFSRFESVGAMVNKSTRLAIAIDVANEALLSQTRVLILEIDK